MLTLVDSTELNLSVLPSRFIVCQLKSEDGNTRDSSCVGATSANKVFISTRQQDQVQYLNIDQPVTALCRHPSDDDDIIALGTDSHLIIYDTKENAIKWNKEIENGVGAVLIGPYGDEDKEVIIVGGNCFIQCFDTKGDEVFWSVMSDQVTALAFVYCDDHNQLIAGTEDGNLRQFKNERLIVEIKETDAVTALSALSDSDCFAYALANGTVGVYYKRNRLWRIKSKNHVVALATYDVDNDGHLELICAWSNGRFNARNPHSGEVVFKENKKATSSSSAVTHQDQHERQDIAALVVGDFLKLGFKQLIVCSRLGQLRSYMPSDLKLTAVEHAKEEAEEEIFRRLQIRKQTLLAELEFIQQQKVDKTSEVFKVATNKSIRMELIHGDDSVELLVQVDPDVGLSVEAVIVFAEGVFTNGESQATCRPDLDSPSTSVRLPLSIQNIGISADLHVNILLNQISSNASETAENILQEIELVCSLPTFARLKPIPWPTKRGMDESALYRIKLRLQERIQRIGFWIETNFIAPLLDPIKSEGPIILAFEILPWRTKLRLSFLTDGYLVIDSDRLDAAAAIIQHLASFLNVNQIASDIQISDDHMRELVLLTSKVKDLQVLRQRLQIDMTNQTSEIRSVFAESESARILGDFATMRRCYVDLQSRNQQLIATQGIRNTNYVELMECLKQINLFVLDASRCRVGKFQQDVIQNSRAAIKDLDFDHLIKIMLHGIDNNSHRF